MNKIIESLQAFSGKTGFYYKNLLTGEALSYHAELPLVAASVIKIPVLIEVFRRLEEGSLSNEERFVIADEDKLPSCGALSYMHTGLGVTLEDLYTLMIILSDNTATNLLIKHVGMDSINRTMRGLGLTTIALNRLLFDGTAFAAGIENYISAQEIGILLEKMYRGELISPKADETMLEILKKQRLNGKIPFALPPKTVVAHKTGEDKNITHDVGIVWAKEPFVVCFCSNEVDVPSFERVIQEISLTLYNAASV